MEFFFRKYESWVLGRPSIVLVILALILGFFSWNAANFRLDASADSLLLDDDEDLKIFRELSERFDSQDFLVVAFSPKKDVFNSSSLEIIESLARELDLVDGIESVASILDAPLLSQAESITELAGGYKTLRDKDIDKDEAREELTSSPIFSELAISVDGKITALQLNLKPDSEIDLILTEKNDLKRKIRLGQDVPKNMKYLEELSDKYENLKAINDSKRHEIIKSVREILSQYSHNGELILGGVSMIADDMITFIRHDLVVFGSSVLLFLIIMLFIFFGSFSWVILPLGSCLYSGIVMIGLLGFLSWEVTVISSNFIALMLILTMSMNIHLIVRFRQLSVDFSNTPYNELVYMTMRRMFWPCLYTALTTILAFGSLVFSSIKPVIDFGWMMSIGLTVTFLASFLFFPTLLLLMKKPVLKNTKSSTIKFTKYLANLTSNNGAIVILVSISLALLAIVGITRIEVENSFINYFKKDTEIYQGLKLIDSSLGGTTPLDVLLTFDSSPGQNLSEIDESDDELMMLFDSVSEGEKSDYWFTLEKIKTIADAHELISKQNGVGQVLSLASIIEVGERVSKSSFDTFELSILYNRIPQELKKNLLDPYLSIEDDQARIRVRVRDSIDNLRRDDLIKDIRIGLIEEIGLDESSFQLSGLLVLYNNMLQSLFKSQILSLGFVMFGVAIMLMLLFKSWKLALIGLLPNLLAAMTLLGLMGWMRISLDMMTITIASITLGIAIDNSIHYIYRFRDEFRKSKGYSETLYYCHSNIGRAIFYTTITIIVGFSILLLSNFVPTVIFGLLTALGMAIALLASLTLLPKLILIIKPFD